MRLIFTGAFALLVTKSTAHYLFSRLIVNRTITPEWKYVRNVTADPTFPNQDEWARLAPQYDINHSDIACGRSAFFSACQIQTADVMAGEEMGFKVAEVMNSGREYSSEIFHPGPAQVYLAKTENLENFTGISEEAEWFKIASFAAKSDTEWITYYQDSVNFTIPATTPPGKYLLRIEQFMPSSTFNSTQWYVNCAQVNIIGSGGGSLEGYKYAKFPGTYNVVDPGLWLQNGMDIFNGLSKYVAPGPEVWNG